MNDLSHPLITDNVTFQIGHEAGLVRFRVGCGVGAIEAILTPDLARHLSKSLWNEADTITHVDALVQVTPIDLRGRSV